MNAPTFPRLGAAALVAATACFVLAGLAAAGPAAFESRPAAAQFPFSLPGAAGRPLPGGPVAVTGVVAPDRPPGGNAAPAGRGAAAGGAPPGRPAEPGSASTEIGVTVPNINLGELTVTPATGRDTTRIRVRTSGPCAAPSDGVAVRLTGPGAFATGVQMVAPTITGFSTTKRIRARLELTLGEAAASLRTPLVAGTYQLVLVCLDRSTNPVTASGLYRGELLVVSPTEYRTRPSGRPITATHPPPRPTTGPTTAPAPRPTTGATATAGPSRTGPSGRSGPPPSVAIGDDHGRGDTDPGPRSRGTGTGNPATDLSYAGLGLTGLGACLLFAGRRRVIPPATEESP